MAANISTFKSAKALAMIEKIVAVLKEQDGGSTRDVATATGMARAQARLYLRHMKTLGLVVCTEESVPYLTGSTGAHWEAVDEAPALPEAEAQPERDTFPRKVIVRQEWEPHHARSRFDCFLFGVPPVLEGVFA